MKRTGQTESQEGEEGLIDILRSEPYCKSMACVRVLRFPSGRTPPAVLAIREWCEPAREQSWALRGLSHYHQIDVTRLLQRSTALLARSRRLRIKLLA